MNKLQGAGVNGDEISPERRANGYKLAFIINTAIGGLMLLLWIAGAILESIFPSLRGGLAWGFSTTAIICLFIASLCYSKYLHLKQ